MQQTRNAATEHRNAVPCFEAGLPLRSHNARQRFDKYPFLVGHLIGQKKCAAIDVDRRHAEILCKTAWVEIGGVEGFAARVISRETVMAGVAGHMVGDEDPVPLFEAADVATCLGNIAGYFVSQYERCLFDPIPLHDVAAANATGEHLDKQLVGTDFRFWHLLQSEVAVVVVHCNPHALTPAHLGSSKLCRHFSGPLRS